jgi:hypothetical protein
VQKWLISELEKREIVEQAAVDFRRRVLRKRKELGKRIVEKRSKSEINFGKRDRRLCSFCSSLFLGLKKINTSIPGHFLGAKRTQSSFTWVKPT